MFPVAWNVQPPCKCNPETKTCAVNVFPFCWLNSGYSLILQTPEQSISHSRVTYVRLSTRSWEMKENYFLSLWIVQSAHDSFFARLWAAYFPVLVGLLLERECFPLVILASQALKWLSWNTKLENNGIIFQNEEERSKDSALTSMMSSLRK